jgi:hypothetical protein
MTHMKGLKLARARMFHDRERDQGKSGDLDKLLGSGFLLRSNT